MVVNAIEPAHLDEQLKLHFSLALPKALTAELEASVADGKVISPDELGQKYVGDKAGAAALSDWLKGQGFKVDHVTPDLTSLYASGTVEQIQKSLGVHMVRVTSDGVTVTAASDVPGLPEAIGANVQHIGGLQTFVRAHKHFRRQPLNLPAAAAVSDGYTVADILEAYGANALKVKGEPLDGEGQEIGILIDTVPLDGDLTQFWQRNGIANSLANIQKINVGGGPLPPPEGEESLDTEWASGVAPGAKVRVYASGGLDFPSLDRALDQIIADVAARPGLRQVSISLGIGETYLHGPGGEIATQHQKYLRLAAAGVNVFVSSGDAGSNPGPTGHLSNGPLQSEYASSDPYVVGVGGTSLVLGAGGAVVSETGWAGGGGGRSHYFPKPSWQTGPGVDAIGGQRMTPDVSLTADPAHGAMLVLNGAPLRGGIGGTSWSAPVWAAFCALINQGRVKAGKAPTAFLAPQVYRLMGTAAFRDITSGSNGHYSAARGYDMVTGVGTPNVSALFALLP
jgi:kumamolisin